MTLTPGRTLELAKKNGQVEICSYQGYFHALFPSKPNIDKLLSWNVNHEAQLPDGYAQTS
ncbi:hypothetical protein [Shewanella aestuarii]|uniref:Uncharacterized protein n=1 Tax=Shewanella aestuarii TaxID=1028752 RepID=A0A6G9QKH7_9GAMM|nr:hypothetical protein [Shewanella aestuarii]QIR15074.1 hypothetical protein HBH39_11755 [Shewanella aestuarii]